MNILIFHDDNITFVDWLANKIFAGFKYDKISYFHIFTKHKFHHPNSQCYRFNFFFILLFSFQQTNIKRSHMHSIMVQKLFRI